MMHLMEHVKIFLLIKIDHLIYITIFNHIAFAEATTDNRVKFLDLSVPIYHIGKYDWIISLEVAEHIPKQYELVYVDNLVRHAKEGIILSWAKIGQGGHSHINTKDFADVKILMEERGFYHDANVSEIFKSKAMLAWLRDNLNVFKTTK